MTDPYVERVTRQKARTERFDRLAAMVTEAGLDTPRLGPQDDAGGYLMVKGLRTQHLHALTPKLVEANPDLRGLIEKRDAILLDSNWPIPWPDIGNWSYTNDRDDDGDRYIYEHYAHNSETGEWRDIDASSNTPFLDTTEFQLHTLLRFPTRVEIGLHNPIRLENLNKKIFGPLG